jgi:hypothetical protein
MVCVRVCMCVCLRECVCDVGSADYPRVVLVSVCACTRLLNIRELTAIYDVLFSFSLLLYSLICTHDAYVYIYIYIYILYHHSNDMFDLNIF